MNDDFTKKYLSAVKKQLASGQQARGNADFTSEFRSALEQKSADDFYSIRSGMLEKYGVGGGSKDHAATGGSSSGMDDFQTVRQTMLSKYTDEYAQNNRAAVSGWANRFNKAVKGFSDFDTKRNGGFTTDAGGGFGAEIDALIRDFDEISEYADRYGLPNAKRYAQQLRDIQKYIGDNNSFYGQFANEDEYNAWDSDQKKKKKAREDLLAFDTAAGREEIDGLESEYDSLKSKRLMLSNAYNDSSDENQQASIRAQMKEIDSKLDGMKGSIDQKKRYLYTAQNEQRYNLSGNDDFDELSRYEDSEELKGWKKLVSQYNLGYEDATYEYINDQDGAREKILDKSTAYGSSQGKDNSPFVRKHYDLLTPEEVQTYNYIHNTKGKKEADEYLDYMQYTLDERYMQGYAAQVQEYADAHPWKASALSVPANLLSGIGAVDIAGQNLRGKFHEAVTGEYAPPVNYNRDAMSMAVSSSVARGTVSQNIADATGTINMDEKEHPVLSRMFNGKSLGDAYQLGMSMVDSATVGALTMMGIPGGTALLGGSAATQGILDAAENGATDEQALLMGVLNGTFETLFEKYELDSILSNTSDGWLKALVKSMLSEGAGESATTTANMLADTFVMAENSNWQKSIGAYMENGLSEQDAKKQAFYDSLIQIGWDGVGGMLMGGIMEGGAKATTSVVDHYSINPVENAQNKELFGPIASEMVSKAIELNPNSELALKAQKLLNEGKQVPGRMITELMNLNQSSIHKQAADAVRSSAAERLTELGETGDVGAIADAIAKKVNGEKSTVADRKAIRGSKFAIQVAAEMANKNANAAGRQDKAGNSAEATSDTGHTGPATLASLSQKYGDYAEMFRDSYIKGQDLAEYDFAFGVAYEMGKAGGNKSALGKTKYLSGMIQSQREIAYEIGEAAAKREAAGGAQAENYAQASQSASVNQSQGTAQEQEPSQKPGTIQYSGFSIAPNTEHRNTEIRFEGKPSPSVQSALRDSGFKYSNKNKVWFGTGDNAKIADTIQTAMKQDGQSKEVTNGTEEVRVRQGTQRPDSENPGGEIPAVGAAAEGAGGEKGTAPGEPGADGQNIGVIQGGAGKQAVKVPPNVRIGGVQETKDIREARTVAAEHNMEIEFFEGGNLRIEDENGNIFEARAYVDRDNGKMYVREDHGIPAHKLARHEAAHQQVYRGEIDVDAVYDKLVEMYGGEQYVRKLIDLYGAAYDCSDMTAEEIFEEILCDSVAEINAFGWNLTVQRFQKRLKKLVDGGISGKRDAIRGPPSENQPRVKYSLEPYDQHTRDNWSASKRIVLYENEAQYREFIKTAQTDNQMSKKMYFGTVPGDLAALIQEKTGFDVEGFNCSLSANEIRKIFKDHGDESKEALRGQRAITEDDFVRIPDVIQSPDDIKLSPKLYNGKPLINFVKETNGKATVAAVISNKHLDLFVQTAFVGAKKGNLATPTGEQAPINTPEASRGTVSTTSISNPNGNVKGKTSREAVGAAKIEQSTTLIRQQLEYWLGKPKKRNGQFAKAEDVRRVVRNVLAEYQSNADKAGVTKSMQELADLIIQEGDEIIRKGYSDRGITYDELRTKAEDIALTIIENSQVLANEADLELYNDIKSYLRKMPITLTEESDIADFKDLRKRNFGRLLIKKGGNPIDTVWPELQEAFGEGFFPDDITHPADMMIHLEELLNSMDPVFYNPYGGEMPKNVEACANTIMEKLFSEAVQPVSTYMDQELEGLSQQIQQNQEEIRELKQERDQLKARNSELSKEADGVNRYREARNKTQMKNQIRNTAKELDKILNSGTKERNVKEGLRATAGRALNLAQVLFSDMRMEAVLYGMDTSATTAGERKAVDKYIQLASKRDNLKERKKKLLKEAGESAQAWLETEGARNALDEQLKEIRKQMEPLADQLQSVAERERNRLKGRGIVGQAIDQMAVEYKKLADAPEKHLADAYDGLVYDRMIDLKERLGEAYIGDMTMEQMRDVYDILQMMMSTIRHVNTMFDDGNKATLSETRENIHKELAHMQKKNRMTATRLQALNKFLWNNEKPIFAMLRIGSPTLTKLYKNIRKGEDTWYADMEEAKQFCISTREKYGYKKWDFEEKLSFKSNSGMDFELTLQDVMSLYAYFKREKSWDHLIKGGFVYDPNVKQIVRSKLGLKMEMVSDNATAYNVSPDVWNDIVGMLTEEQRGFVDEMQDYLSVIMARKGNDVSTKLYGVKLFREKNYFTLRTASAYNARVKEQQEGSGKIKNSGFTKETKPHASNPIVLTPFMDLWADHVNEMSMYHSFTLPLEDFYRVYNFSSAASENSAMESTVQLIQNAHGAAAVGYIDQLLKDINAGRSSDPREGVLKTLTAKFKKASVMASMSVLLRQFSAGPRAWAMVNPKYFRPQWLNSAKHKKLWAEVKKYAPIAGIKEMGYFDTGLGRSARDYLLAQEYEGFREKLKGFFTDGSYRDELFGKAPSWADEVTWIGIWDAVKRETQATRKDLKVDSEEFMQAAGERFTDVIQMTQVYDSVFARSANMRSGSAAMGAVTAFMGEPTSTINLAEYATRQLKDNDHKGAVKTMCAITTSIVLDSLLGSVMYALRDDDEEKNLLEKYTENVVGNFLNGINVLTYIPVVRDIWSIAQGYDVERADMSLFNSLLDAVTTWGNVAMKDTSKMTAEELEDHRQKKSRAARKVVDSLFTLHGDPVRNIRRDMIALQNAFRPNNWVKSSPASWWDSVINGKNSATPFVGWMDEESRTDKLYAAVLSKDAVYWGRLSSRYKDESALRSAMQKGLRDNDPRIRRAAEAWNKEDWKTYKAQTEAVIASGFIQNDVVLAIRAEAKSLLPEEEKGEKQKKTYSLFTAESYAKAILSDNIPMAEVIKAEILATEQENGTSLKDAEKTLKSGVKSFLKESVIERRVPGSTAEKLLVSHCGMEAKDAKRTVTQWGSEADTGISFEEIKQKYMDDELTSQQAMDMEVKYGGLSRDEARTKIQYWDFQKNYPDIYADDAWFDKYNQDIVSSGTPIKVYMEYRNKVRSVTGEGKKERRMDIINSLPISRSQKDAFYLSEGWAESRIDEAPWR